MRRCYALLGILIFLSLLSSAVIGQDRTELSIDNVISEVLSSNPELRSAKNKYEAASARIWQAASPNDPMFELEYDKINADRKLTGDPMKMYAISQDIPFPTKLYLKAKIAAILAKMEYEKYKAKEKDIVANAKTIYSELWLARRSIELLEYDKTILQQVFSTATSKYSKLEGSQSDALKSQVEIARIESELIMLNQKKLASQAKLNTLMNVDPKQEIILPDSEGTIELSKSIDELEALAKISNPELKAYRYGIDKGKTAYDLSLNEFMPDFTLKYKQMIGRDKLIDGAWAGMIGVTIPVWFFSKQAFGVKEMRAELEMLKAEYKTKENLLMADISDAYARLTANKKVVELYETSFIPQALEAVKAALTGYQSGKDDIIAVLDGQRMLVEFKLDYYKAILELRIASADLERMAGAENEK